MNPRSNEDISPELTTKFVEDKNLICSEQSGFNNAMQANETTIAVFLDFQRVFETIDRDILIQKLKKYCIHSSALQYLKCFLNGRLDLKLSE